jgi:hypothetical protein
MDRHVLVFDDVEYLSMAALTGSGCEFLFLSACKTADRRVCGLKKLALYCLMTAMVVCGGVRNADAQAKTATITTLSVTSGVSAVTTVASGSVVTLTATVTAGGMPLTTGQVNFCDASGTYCTDIHLLATAQLTHAGTAVFKFRPGAGNHSYKAIFTGLTAAAASSSSVSILSITGTTPVLSSTTTIRPHWAQTRRDWCGKTRKPFQLVPIHG